MVYQQTNREPVVDAQSIPLILIAFAIGMLIAFPGEFLWAYAIAIDALGG